MLPWFKNYPNQNDEILNLDFVIKQVENLKAAYEAFLAANSLTFADPILWDITKQYSKNTIVLSPEGDGYLSKKVVGAGVQLNNTDYWLEIFNFAEYVRTANSNLTMHIEQNTTRATAAYAVNDWLLWDDVLYKVTTAISADDLLTVGTNIVHFTVEDFCKAWVTYGNNLINQYKHDIDASELAYKNQLDGIVAQYKSDIDYSEAQYKNQLDAAIANTTATMQAQLNTAIAGATVDSEVINARVAIDNQSFDTLKNAIITQINALFATKQDVSFTKNLETITEVDGYFKRVTTLEVVAESNSCYAEVSIDPDTNPIIYVTAVSASNALTTPLVAFFDVSDNLISRCGAANTSYDNLPVLVPKNAVKLIINAHYGGSTSIWLRTFNYVASDYNRDMYYAYFENGGMPILTVYVRSKYSNKYVKYVFYHYINNSIQFDCWRLWDIRICDSSRSELYSLIAGASSADSAHNIECEGAIKESGAADFIGGYHGDEIMDNISIFVDGEEIALNADIPLTEFKHSVELFVKSHLYRCNTSTIIFKRSKTDVVDLDGLHVKNVFVALDSITIERAALSMLNVITANANNVTLIDSFNSDARNELITIADMSQDDKDNLYNRSASPVLREAHYHGNLIIDVKMRDVLNGQNSKGFFQWFENGAWPASIKIYEDIIQNATISADTWFSCVSDQSIWPT